MPCWKGRYYKYFKYPPILPIVFYDGADNWTATTKLHDRVFFSDIFGKYVPDYQCILVQLKDYSNEELMKKRDELSILMMVDRLQNKVDFAKLVEEVDANYLTEMTSDSPEYLLKLMQQIIGVFLSKLNIPSEEVDAFTEQIKERKMGELFAHFEAWDVQAIRKEAREEAREEVTQQVTKQVTEENIKRVVKVVQELGGTRKIAEQQLMKLYQLTEEEASETVDACWE